MGRAEMSALMSSLLYPLSYGFWPGYETPGLPDACIVGEFNKLKSTKLHCGR